MALSPSLFAGVSGLQVNQVLLDVIGNNLSNSGTAGFKSQRVSFQDLIYETLSDASPQLGPPSGTNPKQIGVGVLVGSIDTDFQQGPLQVTGRTLDLAIEGSGFFVVNDGFQNFYTRAGAFDLDTDGFVIDAATGFRVQRFGTLGEGPPSFQIAGNTGIRVPFGFGIPGQPTGSITLRGNLDATQANGASTTTAIQVFDTQGTEHSLSLTFTKTAANTYSLNATASGGTVTGVPFAPITFNTDGTLNTPATVSLTLNFGPSAATNQTIVLQLGTSGQADGISQFGGENTVAAIAQDGFAAGSLASISIAQNGVIQGVFTNGKNLDLAQLAVATFANPGGLRRDGQNLFSQSANSGVPVINTAQVGGRGLIQSNALENSNVDVSFEFTQLIIAQRAFQINARTVTASSEVLQELANIIR